MKYLALFAILFATSYGVKPSCYECTVDEATNEDDKGCRGDDGDWDVCLTTGDPNYCVECAVNEDCVDRYNQTLNDIVYPDWDDFEYMNLKVCSNFECVECEEATDCTDQACVNATCVDCDPEATVSDCEDGSYCIEVDVNDYECVGCTNDDHCNVTDNIYCDNYNGAYECDYGCNRTYNYTGPDCDSHPSGSWTCDESVFPFGCVVTNCNATNCEEGEYCDTTGYYDGDNWIASECRPWTCNMYEDPHAYCTENHPTPTQTGPGQYLPAMPMCNLEDSGWYDGCSFLSCYPGVLECSSYGTPFASFSVCTDYTDVEDHFYGCDLGCQSYNNTWCADENNMQTYSCKSDGTCGVQYADDLSGVCPGGYDTNSDGECAYNCEDDVLEKGCNWDDVAFNYYCAINGTNTCEPDTRCSVYPSLCGIQETCNDTSEMCYDYPSTCDIDYGTDADRMECNIREDWLAYNAATLLPNFICSNETVPPTCVPNDNCWRGGEDMDLYCGLLYQSYGMEGFLIYQCNNDTESADYGNCNLNPDYDCQQVGCKWLIDIAALGGHVCPGFPFQMPCSQDYPGECDKGNQLCSTNGDCDEGNGYVCSDIQSAQMYMLPSNIKSKMCVLGCSDNDDCNAMYCSAGDFGEEGNFVFEDYDASNLCEADVLLTCDTKTNKCKFADDCEEDTDCEVVPKKTADDVEQKCLNLPFRPNICYVDCNADSDYNGVCDGAYGEYFKNANQIKCKNVTELNLYFCDIFDGFIPEFFEPTSAPSVVVAEDDDDDEGDDAVDGINILSIFGAITITIFIKSFM